MPDADEPEATDADEYEPLDLPAQNTIYFGPPGVGKSHAVEELTKGWRRHRTVFHPEYAFGDFVGTYRPIVLRNESEKIKVGGKEVARYVNTFEFVPGPMVDALVDAHEHPDESVVLIIEEINRGDCASIFGPFFQLLDRDSSGQSEYGITVDPALANYLTAHGVTIESGIRLPKNLSLFATMNTADQGLFPMDAAFKRRWSWRSVALMSGEDKLKKVKVAYGDKRVLWTRLIDVLNRAVLKARENEDKQVGPWYVRFEKNEAGERVGVVEGDLRDKLLFYLWHDVFRNHRGDFFDPDIERFDDLQLRYENHTIRGVLNDSVRKDLGSMMSDDAADVDAGSEDEATAEEE